MKNVLICNNCGNENPLYGVNCTSCGSYLRERIFNIDLWSTISLIVESPVKGFQRIIQSEHKNFLILILFLTFIKFWINTIFVSLYLFNNENTARNFLAGFLITASITLVMIILISLLIKAVIKTRVTTRFKDLFSILTYSQIPYFFAAMILFPLELIIFGEFLFSINPSPFITKETIAYFMLVIEILIILWGILLTIFALFSQTGNIKFSIVFGVFGSIILFIGIIISSTIQQIN